MKSTINVFQKGLRSDAHPLATDNQTLTDALNATFVTYNGNELMLQNDMGNTKIQDSTTGHIMGLSEGFIPIGMKEYGGIMYIASVNKNGQGELGMIPSPIYTLTSKGITPDTLNQVITDTEGPSLKYSILNNTKLYPGDRFMVWLRLEDPNNSSLDVFNTNLTWQIYVNGISSNLIRPLLTNIKKNELGLYNINLYSVYGSGATKLEYAQSTNQKYWFKGDITYRESNYWFIPWVEYDESNFDAEATFRAKEFKSYPGTLPPGRLAIKASLEGVDSFSLIRIKQPIPTAKQTYTFAPAIEKLKSGKYRLHFMGYQYTGKSARFINAVKSTLYNQNEAKNVGSWEHSVSNNEMYSVTDTTPTNEYTLQLISSGNGSYKKPITTSSNVLGLSPLFTYDMGKDLNVWFTINVEYYDVYEGLIDTYSYSFNPYHILNYEESYQFNWQAANFMTQLYDTSKGATETITIQAAKTDKFGASSINKIYDTYTQISKGSYADYYWDPIAYEGYCFPTSLGTPYGECEHTVLTMNIPGISSGYTYLYPNNALSPRKVEISNSNAFSTGYIMVQDGVQVPWYYKKGILNNCITWYWSIKDKGGISKESGSYSAIGGPSPVETSNKIVSGSYFNDGTYYMAFERLLPDSVLIKDVLELTEDDYRDVSVSLILDVDSPPVSGSIANSGLYAPNSSGDPYSLSPAKDDYGEGDGTGWQPGGEGSPPTTAKLNEDTSIRWQHYNHQDPADLEVRIPQVTTPNLSPYEIVPYFSLTGSSEENSSIRALGLDGRGRVKDTWNFAGQELLEFVVPTKTQSVSADFKPESSFVKEPKYFPETGSTTSSIVISEPGVYLLNINAYSGPLKSVKDLKTTVHANKVSTKNRTSALGYYTTYNDSTGNDPQVGFKIGDVIYDIAKCDWNDSGNVYRTFLPTLIYIPEMSICSLEWRNVKMLNGLGLYRLAKSVVLNNGDIFGTGNEVKVMYYQHPDIKGERQPVLPLEFSYLENGACIDTRYSYYQGVTEPFVTNIHIDTTDMIVSSEMENRPADLGATTGVYIDSNVYIRDKEQKAIKQFLYKWDEAANNETVHTPTTNTAGDLPSSTELTFRQNK